VSHPIGRRQALRTLGAPAVLPLLAPLHPWVPRQEGESAWQPRFLQPGEVETVTQLAERIVPETDTPGARRALVHQYIDFVLSRREPPRQDAFRAGLAWLDARSRTLFGTPFAGLDAARQDELLKPLAEAQPSQEAAGIAFFAAARELTVEGYYRSEAGMIQELGFAGRTFLAEFPGCTHPEHRDFKIDR
jgi:hypothetical protein